MFKDVRWEDTGEPVERLGLPAQAKNKFFEGLAATGEGNCTRAVDINKMGGDWPEDLVYLEDLGQHGGSSGESGMSRAGRITNDQGSFDYSVTCEQRF